MTAKQWIFENIGQSFISIHAAGVSQAIPPGQSRPVTAWFKRSDGSPDLDAARGNASVKQHIDSGMMVMREMEHSSKIPHIRPFNETDPLETRVAKVLEHRRQLKSRGAASLPVRVKDPEPAEPELKGRKPKGE